jgi:hypothetical protein
VNWDLIGFAEEPQGESLGCDVANSEVVMADQMLARISVLDKEGWCIRVVSKGRGKASNRVSHCSTSSSLTDYNCYSLLVTRN